MRILPFLAFAAATLASTAGSAEDAVVISSTAPAYALGNLVPADGEVRLPDGASAVFLLASGRTVSVRGPFEGKVADAARPKATGEVGQIWSTQRYTQADIAASRSVGRGAEALDKALAIDPSAEGRHCVLEGVKPLLRRPARPGFERVALADETGRGRWSPIWASGDFAEPPAGLPLRDGARIRALGQGLEARIELRAIGAEAAKERGIPIALASAGCHHQAKALLAPLRDAVAPLELYLSTDRGTNPTYRSGESASLVLRTNRDARVSCLILDKRGTVTTIFPSPASGGGAVRAEEELRLPGERAPLTLVADDQDVRCVAAEPGPGELTDPSAAFRPLSAEAARRLDRALADGGRGPAASGQVLLRVE